MSRAYFEYNGINSLDMGIHIENEIAFPSPERDVDFIDVLGRDGSLAIDNDRFKDVNFSLPIRVKAPEGKTLNDMATLISNWLKSDVGWHTLKFSGSPDYEYIAMCYEQFDILETLIDYGRTVLTFRMKPYKMKGDLEPIVVERNQIITNDTGRIAKPIVRVEGLGDIRIFNYEAEWISIEGMADYLEINSELMTVYRDGVPQYNKVVDLGEFPVLYPGINQFTWEGKVSKLIILPRWEAIT